jgi:hypothetical protein
MPPTSHTSTVKVLNWKVDVPNVAGTPGAMWNGSYTMGGTTMHLAPPSWNANLAPGATNDGAGFCASR